jgi:GNAT superfamily N-acetyltransferase
MIVFRNMIPSDIPAGLSLCRHAGWNQLARDWEIFLLLYPDGCRVAVDENKSVVGTVVTLPYQERFTWIGMVLVHPDKRRQGIGNQLLQEALQLTKHHGTIKLDATPEGREVYLKLNFVDEYHISRMYAGKPMNLASPSPSVRPLQPDHFPQILQLDYDVFGAGRQRLLEWHYEGARQFGFVVEKEDKIQGYCLGRQGYNFNQIGPVVATHIDHAVELVTAALQNSVNKPVILDVLDQHKEWVKFIRSIGFEIQRPLIRMYRGSNAFPGKPEYQFTILGPEFG